MADVKKTVEIALKVVGIDFAQLSKLTKTFESISTSADKAKKSIDGLQRSLKTIKAPTNLTKTVQVLERLGKVKLPSLVALSNGLKKISEIKQPPKLTTFITDLKKFANIKLPGIDRIVAGFKKLTTVNIAGVISKIRSLNRALLDLDKRGGMSVFKKFANDVNHMRNSFNQAAAASTKITQAFAKTGNAAEQAGLKVRTFGDKVATIFSFRLISVALQGIQQAMLSGLSAITQYDQALKDLQAITGATTLEVAQMGIKILEVASTTKFSAEEVAAGMRTIGQAGFSASEAVETMQAVSDLATGTLSDMTTTVDLVTTAMRVFQIDATRSGEVADVFANAVNRSKLTVDKLRTAMNYIGPIARDSGVTFKELASSMGTLANSGLRASTIGTGLRRVFAELIDPSKKLKAAADEAGVALADLDPRTSSLSDVMSNLRLVVDDAQKAFDLFGKRGASAVLALSSSESRFNEMLTTISRSGTAAKQAAIQMEGLGVSFKNLKDKLGILAIAIGEAGLADAMRLIINLSRTLIDALTLLASTTAGKIVISFGLLTAAALAFSGVLVALASIAKIPMFVSLIAEIKIVIALLGGATTAVWGFLVSLGPLGALLLALGAAWLFLGDSVKETADDFILLSDKYDILAKKFQDYRLKTVSMAEGSKELKDANLDLRQSLFATATAYGEVAIEARAAADAINPITGEIIDNGEALDTYNKKLDNLKFTKLKLAAAEVNKEIENSGKGFDSFMARTSTRIKNLSNLFGKNYDAMSSSTRASVAFAKAIGDGTASMQDMEDYVAGLDMSNLTDQEQEILDLILKIDEYSSKFVQSLVESNKVGLDDTVEDFTIVAKKAGYTNQMLDKMIIKFKKLKDLSADDFSTSLEKWAKKGTGGLTEFIDKNKVLLKALDQTELAELKSLEARKRALVETYDGLDAIVEKERAAGVSVEQIWKNYNTRKAVLDREAEAINIAESKIAAGNILKIYLSEKEKLEKEKEKVEIKYEGDSESRVKLRYKHLFKLEEDFNKKKIKLLKGQQIDPAEQAKTYKLELQERETEYSKHLDNLSILEAKGLLTADETKAAKLLLDIEFYRESYAAAVVFRDQVDKLDQPALYAKRQKVVLKLEEDFYNSKTKFLITYNKEYTKAAKKIEDIDKKIRRKKLDFEKDTEKRKKDLVKKLLKIDQDYADKREDIENDLKDALTEIDDDILSNRKSARNDILSLESSTEEKIRLIKEGGLEGEAKEKADKRAADKYLAEGVKLVADAQRDKDTEQLSRGVALIRQAESIGGGLKNQRDSVNFLKDALSGLKAARNVEAEIAELELLQKKEEEIAEAAAKSAASKAAYDEKVMNAQTAFEDINDMEMERHSFAMANLYDELDLWKEKVKLAQKMLGKGVDGEKVKGADPSTAGSANVVKTTSAAMKQAEEIAQNGYRVITENGVRTFTNLVEGQKTAFDAIVEDVSDSGVRSFKALETTGTKTWGTIIESVGKDGVRSFAILEDASETATAQVAKDLKAISDEEIQVKMDTAELDETQETLEEVDNTVLDVLADVVGKDNVDALKKSIDGLKDKVVTITTKYVTQGRPDEKKEGGRLPGYGGGDRNPVLAEDGEWFIRKEAVRKYGDAFMSGINNMSLPKFQTGGRVGIPASMGDGSSGGTSETLVVRFQAGGVEAPVNITDPSSRSAMKQIANELTKMRLVYAR